MRKAEKFSDLMVGSHHAGDCGEALTAPDFHQGDRKLTARQVGGLGKQRKWGHPLISDSCHFDQRGSNRFTGQCD